MDRSRSGIGLHVDGNFIPCSSALARGLEVREGAGMRALVTEDVSTIMMARLAPVGRRASITTTAGCDQRGCVT
jgi:hypothetical protein